MPAGVGRESPDLKSASSSAMEAAVFPDWSEIPEDLMAMVMRGLDIPDLFQAGAVCTSWYAAYSAVRRVRIPIKDASPCLLYSCADDDADTATLYSPAGGVAFKVRLPAPAFRTRHVVGAGHGWLITADEESNLRLLNPLTAEQVDLPPATELHHVERFSDEHGRHMYNLYGEEPYPDTPCAYSPKQLQLSLYHRAYITCSASAGASCLVLLLHRPNGQLSFARLGDNRWTHVAETEFVQRNSTFRCAAYNNNDSLFYLLSSEGSIFTLDLNGTSPVVRMVLQGNTLWDDPVRSIVFAPWGDILHVWKCIEVRHTPGQVPPELQNEVIDPDQEMYTDEIELHKIDIDYQKFVKISSSELRGHALFLGFNSTMLFSTKKFPVLKPNCAYITDDSWEHISINKYGRREVGIWSFETEMLESVDNLQSAHTRLNWPPPIWIKPSLR